MASSFTISASSCLYWVPPELLMNTALNFSLANKPHFILCSFCSRSPRSWQHIPPVVCHISPLTVPQQYSSSHDAQLQDTHSSLQIYASLCHIVSTPATKCYTTLLLSLKNVHIRIFLAYFVPPPRHVELIIPRLCQDKKGGNLQMRT